MSESLSSLKHLQYSIGSYTNRSNSPELSYKRNFVFHEFGNFKYATATQSETKQKWQRKIEIKIADKVLYIEPKLTNILNCIKESEYILNLKDDWDDENAFGCNSIIYYRAIEVLTRYSQFLFTNYGIVIDIPEINLAKDGSVDLEWRNDTVILLINIQNTDIIDIHYYGEDFKTKTILKGFIDSFRINKDLAFWMQKINSNGRY